MKVTCECGESINIHKSRDATLVVDWIDWIADHLFRHSAIYCKEGDPFNLTFRPSEPAPVKIYSDDGSDITEQWEKDRLRDDLQKKVG